ncbi:MAG TPA: M48 family metallopeptidase, partial [Bryobacteraceae bacterium]|nr:M48 family metallopeptidase [Bryobacteraceae bacterium]
MNMRRIVPQIVLTAGLLLAADKQRTLKPGWNLFSPDQDVKMGQEYSQQIEREVQVVNDPTLHAYVNQIGSKLVNAIEGQKFPFTFKVVNDPSINAFALPGGPMYVHTGLIAAADNEAQIAGVLGHEMGHVMLRHGTNQASKANLIQIPAMIAAGVLDRGGMIGSLAQMGIGLGANSVLMKFSRTAESDADLYGARLVHRAGYNPVELARFFEKLEAESGKGSAVSQFFSDHPNPGNRINNIQGDMKFYEQKNYVASNMTPELSNAKAIIKRLPAPAKRPAQGQQSSGSSVPAPQGPAVTTSVPSGFKAYQNTLYAMAYPDDWSARPGQDGVSATLSASDGVVRGQNNQEDIGHGVILNFVKPQSNDLNAATDQLIQGIMQGNPNLKTNGAAQSIRIDNFSGRITPMQGPSSMRSGERENVLILTVMHPQGMLYGVFIAPESRWRVAEPEYRQMMQSLRFGGAN